MTGGFAPSAVAQCVYTELEDNVSQTITPTGPVPQRFLYSFNQTRNRWAGIAIRPTQTDSWDLNLYGQTTGLPNCLDDQLAFSEWGDWIVDFVVGDFHHIPLGTYYPDATHLGTDPENGVIEWDDGSELLAINDTLIVGQTGSSDIIEIYDIFLRAGVYYTFKVQRDEDTYTRMYLFHNPADAPFWGYSADAEFMTLGEANYTPSVSDDYALVVVNGHSPQAAYRVGYGVCTPPQPLRNQIPSIPGGYQNYFAVDQTIPNWTAIGYRHQGMEHGIETYRLPSGPGWPTCLGQQLYATSTTDDVALLLGYLDPVALPLSDTAYVRIERTSGGPTPLVQWDGEAGTLIVDDPPVTGELGQYDAVRVWNIELVGDGEYVFDLACVGSAKMEIRLFSRLNVQNGWTSVSEFQTSGLIQYQAEESAIHGLALINKNGGSGSYSLSVSTCPAPNELAEELWFESPVGSDAEICRFVQETRHWFAVAVSCFENFDLSLYEHFSGGAWPTCWSGELANSSEDGGIIDFIVGDGTRNQLGAFYPRLYRTAGANAQAHVEWDSGGKHIRPDGVQVIGEMLIGNMIELSDVYLIGGLTYDIVTAPTGSAVFTFYIFRSTSDSYWATRGDCELEFTGSVVYTAPTTGWYGLVVVNENGGQGTFPISITPQNVAAGGDPAARTTGIRSLAPNPTTGGVNIHFDVRTPGVFGFEFFDVAGRLVATIPSTNWATGTWTARWNGLTSRGQRVAAGVYFVKMYDEGHVLALKKFIVLD
jgi:hypothetical protein